MYGFIYHRTGDHEKTEDIVADTYMKALRRISGFRGNHEGEFFSWIYRIAYTTLIDDTRSARPTEELDDTLGYSRDLGHEIDTSTKLGEVVSSDTHRARADSPHDARLGWTLLRRDQRDHR